MQTTTPSNGPLAPQESQAGSANTIANLGGAAATNGGSLASQNGGGASQGAEVAAQAAQRGSQGLANAEGEVTMIPGGVRVPVLTGGWQTTEFLLSLVVLAGIFAALWCGKIDAGLASALLGLVATAYPGLRTWLKAQHLDKVAQVLAAQNGPHADVYHAAAAALAAVDSEAGEPKAGGAWPDVGDWQPNQRSGMRQAADTAASTSGGWPPATAAVRQPIPDSGAGVGPQPSSMSSSTTGAQAGLAPGPVLAVVAAAGAGLALGMLVTGCANAPYYVSGVDASVTTGSDGQGITGGAVGVSITPNPGFVSGPVNPAPAKSGTAGVKASTIPISIPLPAPASLSTSAPQASALVPTLNGVAAR